MAKRGASCPRERRTTRAQQTCAIILSNNGQGVITMENQAKCKRLNKYISDSGYCSRREADRLISEGRVRLDGRVGVLGDRVLPGMDVTVHSPLKYIVGKFSNTIFFVQF